VTLAHGQRLAHVDGLRGSERVIGGRDHALAAAHLLVQMHQVGLLGIDGVQARLEEKVGADTHGLYSGCLLTARGSCQAQRMLSSVSNMMLLTSTMRDAARYCSSACSMLMYSSFRFTPETSCCAAKVWLISDSCALLAVLFCWLMTPMRFTICENASVMLMEGLASPPAGASAPPSVLLVWS